MPAVFAEQELSAVMAAAAELPVEHRTLYLTTLARALPCARDRLRQIRETQRTIAFYGDLIAGGDPGAECFRHYGDLPEQAA